MEHISGMVSAVACGLVLHVLFNTFEENHMQTLKFCAVSVPLLLTCTVYPISTLTLYMVTVIYAICYGTLFASILLYRISPFHPLAKYPGPFLAKCSKLWGLYQVSTGKIHLVFADLHVKYGTVVRTGPNELSVCELSAVNASLGTNGMPKGPMWKGRTNPRTGKASLASERNIRVHLERRKPWNRGLNTASVKEYEPVLRNRVFQLVEHLQEKSFCGTYVDLAEWISMFSYDFMGDMAFGGLGFELMREGDINGVWNTMEQGIRIQAFTQHVPWVRGILHTFSGMGKSAAKLRQFVLSTAQKRANRGIGPNGPDLSSWLLDELNPSPDPMQFYTYAREALLIMVAGSDTSASVISSIFHYVLTERVYFEKLRDEIDKTFPRNQGDLPANDSSKLVEMPFLNAVINEAMRLAPPVPVDIQRSPENGSGGRMIGSVFIPEGTGVHISPYIYHRDPRYFSPYPDSFIPERWLPNPTGLYHTVPEAFFPFSLGPMNCPGKGLALLELRMVVATLVHGFDMNLQRGYDTTSWERKSDCYFVLSRGHLPVKLKWRTPQGSCSN